MCVCTTVSRAGAGRARTVHVETCRVLRVAKRVVRAARVAPAVRHTHCADVQGRHHVAVQRRLLVDEVPADTTRSALCCTTALWFGRTVLLHECVLVHTGAKSQKRGILHILLPPFVVMQLHTRLDAASTVTKKAADK